MDRVSDLTDGFVDDFAERLTVQWNHGPCVFRNALRAPLFTGRDFMTALRGAAGDYVSDPHARVPPGRVYLGGEPVKPEQLPPLLPRNGETQDQYVTRIGRAHPNQDLGIVLDNCEKHVPAMRDRLVPVLHHLFTRVRYPARRNHLCVYAGTYKSTPFGIHRDDCHVVMFCMVGRKAMAFWPRPYFDEKKELFVNGKVRARLDDHIAHATVLEIGPLDVLYWSADDYHVAISDTNEFQAALSVGIYHHGSSPELMTSLDFLTAVTRVEGLDIQGLPAASMGRMSAEDLRTAQMIGFFERWDQLRDMMSRLGEAEFRALGVAVRLVSSAGYGKVRTSTTPPETPDLIGRTLICTVPESLVVAHVRGGVMVGANGSAFVYGDSPQGIEHAVLSFRDGKPHRFGEVISAANGASPEKITAVVRDLVNAGAVSVDIHSSV